MRKIVRWALIFLLVLNVLYVISGVWNYPMRSMDAFSDWMLKAKVLYIATTFPFDFFRNWEYMASHMQHPLLLPYVFSLLYLLVGIQEKLVLLIYPIMYARIRLPCSRRIC